MVRMFGRAVVGVARRLISLNSAMRVVKLVGITLATRYALKFAEAIVLTSRKIGLTNNELIGLQFAAGVAGIKIADLTKHLERMSPKLKTIQDVLKGMGVQRGDLALMVQIIEKLGLSMTQLQGQMVMRAVATVRSLWTVIKAVSLELAVRLAPAVKFVANELLNFVVLARVAVVELAKRLEPHILAASERLVQFAKAGANAGSTVPLAFGLIAEAGAKLANAIKFIEAAWHGLSAATSLAVSHMLIGADKVLDAMRHILWAVKDFVQTLADSFFIPRFLLAPIVNQINNAQDAILDTHTKITGMITSLTTQATGSFEKMNKAWAEFASGKAGDDFKSWFEDIAERAKAIVADVLKLQKIGLKIPDLPSPGALGAGAAAARARTTEFQQISLARVALAGVTTPSRPQIVRDPQLVMTNDLLNKIRFSLMLPGIGLTS